MGIRARLRAAFAPAPVLWQLTPDRAEEWRAIRLAALTDCPEAFDHPTNDPSQGRLEDCIARLTQAQIWAGGDRPGTALAVAAWEPGWTAGTETMGWISGVYARPEGRGRGLVAALLARIADRAADAGMDRLGLRVGVANLPAKRCYRAAGFAAVGAPFVNEAGLVEIEMRRALRAGE